MYENEIAISTNRPSGFSHLVLQSIVNYCATSHKQIIAFISNFEYWRLSKCTCVAVWYLDNNIPCAFQSSATAFKSTVKLKFNASNLLNISNPLQSEDNMATNKHIKFDDDDDDIEAEAVAVQEEQPVKKGSKKSEKNRKNAIDIGTKWYHMVCLQII